MVLNKILGGVQHGGHVPSRKGGHSSFENLPRAIPRPLLIFGDSWAEDLARSPLKSAIPAPLKME